MAQVGDAPAAADGLIQAVDAALAQGDVMGAVAAAEHAVEVMPESPHAHEALGDLTYGALDQYARGGRHYETAYRLFRRQGEIHAAARLALKLGHAAETLGKLPLQRGWISRAKRLLEEIRPCLEEGYYYLATVACDLADVHELESLTLRALEVARRYGDLDLEIRAIAECGLALVSQGRLEEGMALLDEAAAGVLGGEMRDLASSGYASCAVVSGYERMGDLEHLMRFTEELDLRSAAFYRGFRPPILLQHCRQAYGGLLGEAGRLEEAETQLTLAVDTSGCIGHKASATGRLAALRIHQNRIDEAAELLRGWEDRYEVAGPLARLHDARGELELARSTLRLTLRERSSDILSAAPMWAHLADLEARLRDPAAAAAAVEQLDKIVAIAPSPLHRSLALLARARATAAADGDPEPALLDALGALRGVERPLLRGAIHMELAQAKRSSAPAEAITEARAAHAIYERLGAKRELDRAAALLREMGVRVRPAGAAESDPSELLSRRELEILPLLAEGLSNAEIAARIFVSPKTVEHHVSAILGKLGARKRSEAAAWAATRIGRTPDASAPRI